MLVRTDDSTLLSTGKIQSQSVPYVLEWDFNAHKEEKIPEAHLYKPELLLDVFDQDDGTYVIKLQIDGNPVEETFFFDQLAIAATKINSSQTSLEVSLGNRRSSTTLTLESFETKDFGARFREFINNNLVLSEFAEPLLKSVESLAFKIPSIPAFFAVNFTSNVLLYQFREDTAPVSCKYVPKDANLDTVVITASEKDIHRVKDKLLVLHLVTEDNYPDRQRGAGLWVIQIPAPLAEYVWEEHFENLRWQRGNLYAQMNLEGYKTTVSGWFESEDAANNWFDAVLSLTRAVEENRIVSLHKTPKTNITVQTTRPYRAFITDTDGNGNAVCLTKYKPIIINE